MFDAGFGLFLVVAPSSSSFFFFSFFFFFFFSFFLFLAGGGGGGGGSVIILRREFDRRHIAILRTKSVTLLSGGNWTFTICPVFRCMCAE